MVLIDVQNMYRKINSNLPIITDESVMRKLDKLHEMYKNVKWGKANKDNEKSFMNSLDRIFDAIHCSCPIKSCKEFGCFGCTNKVHITCKCENLKNKIPLIELEYVKDHLWIDSPLNPSKMESLFPSK